MYTETGIRPWYTTQHPALGEIYSTTPEPGWRLILPRVSRHPEIYVGPLPETGRFVVQSSRPRPRIPGTTVYDTFGPRTPRPLRPCPRSRRRRPRTRAATRFKARLRRWRSRRLRSAS